MSRTDSGSGCKPFGARGLRHRAIAFAGESVGASYRRRASDRSRGRGFVRKIKRALFSIAAGFFFASTAHAAFQISGLTSPATVTEQVYAAVSGAPSGTTAVQWTFDGTPIDRQTATPYWLGGAVSGRPVGFSLHTLQAGTHTLKASAIGSGGSTTDAPTVTLTVVTSINATLSNGLMPYANHPSAQQLGQAGILSATLTPGVSPTSTETALRQQIVAMYMAWGIDLSLDGNSSVSTVLPGLTPKGWKPNAGGTTFSSDSPVFQPIPAQWPKVALPTGYLSTFQLNTVHGGDGIGYGVASAAASDPMTRVRSEYFGDVSTRVDYTIRVPSTWKSSIPDTAAGDQHVIFEDVTGGVFLSTYKVSADPSTGVDADYASPPTPFNSLGDAGGSNTTYIAERPFLIKAGEATGPSPIPHAVAGPVQRVWKARAYPGSGYDDGLQSAPFGDCGDGIQAGLIPYGGIIQLDPTINVNTLSVSLPAKRILQAMQTYGYYVIDFGCGDLDIYTMTNETEWDPYGGLYGNSKGPGVQNEVQTVIKTAKFYVVPPLTKKGPVLTITSPAQFSSVVGPNISVAYAMVSGMSGIGKVSFQLDGGTAINDTALNGTHAFTGVAAGTHTVTAWLASGTGTEVANSRVQIYFTATGGTTPTGPTTCDVNGDGAINVSDVQSAVNQVLGTAPCGTGDLQHKSSCDAVDVQRMVNVVLGGACVIGP